MTVAALSAGDDLAGEFGLDLQLLREGDIGIGFLSGDLTIGEGVLRLSVARRARQRPTGSASQIDTTTRPAPWEFPRSRAAPSQQATDQNSPSDRG